MIGFRWTPWVGAGLLAAVLSAPVQAQTFDMGGIGSPEILQPAGTPTGVVALFSDAGGWGERERTLARSLTDSGILVMGIDTPATLKRIEGFTEDACADVIGEVEAVSHQLQSGLGLPSYHFPVVTGSGLGGAVVVALAGQTEEATVASLVAVDPQPFVPGTKPICSRGRITETGAGRFYALPPPPTRFTLKVIESASATMAQKARMQGLRAGISMGARFKVVADPVNVAMVKEALLSVPQPVAPPAAGIASDATGAASVADLPLEPMPVEPPSDTFVVFYSGDGGWRDLDKDVAAVFQEQGIPVVGVDVLRYFWKEQSPDASARDLSRIIRAYSEEWNASSVILIGFSFGADVLPFLATRLPAEDQAQIRQMTLLGLSDHADFEVTVSNWLANRKTPLARQTLPEIRRLPPQKIQCIYGEKDEDNACRKLVEIGVEVVKTPGGHHFGKDYPALARLILAGLEKRQPATGSGQTK